MSYAASDENWPDIDALDASVYAEQLAGQWRSLLDESDATRDESLREASFFFRPRGGLGLEPSTASGASSCSAGDVLDDFELLRLVGEGGMGQVWEAHQRRLDRSIALKLVRPDRLTPLALEFFSREGRAAARLRHPAIVTVFAMGESEGTHWIAQEFVEGECTLADYLTELGERDGLPRNYDRRIALFFFQLAEGLAYAHDEGVVHGDLKPQNVLIAEGDRPKLTDFGLARLEEEGAAGGTGFLQGTPRYMSPEQVLGTGSESGRSSDVFSLGTMLYHALTLHYPFDGENVTDLLEAVARREPVPCRAHRAGIDPDLAAIVWLALRKEPTERYASMRLLSDDLAAYLDGRPVFARPISLVERGRKLLRRRPKQAAVVVGGILAALALVALTLAWRSASQEARTERWLGHLFEANLAVERDDEETALNAVQRAEAELPDQARTPLVMAGLYARMGQTRQARNELKKAQQRGYDPSAAGDDAFEQYLLGVYHMASTEKSAYAAAEEAFQRAWTLDADQRAPLYPLAVVARAMGKRDVALQALAEFQRGLQFGDPRTRMIEGLMSEIRGNLDAALGTFEELAADSSVDRDELERHGFSQSFGRLSLKARRFEEAAAQLEFALESRPDNFVAGANLALARLALSRQDDLALEARLELLDGARAAAELAADKDYGPERRVVLELLVHVEADRNRLTDASESGARDQLEALDPQNRALASLRAQAEFDAGYDAFDAGRTDDAIASLQAGLELQPERFLPHVILGQAFGFQDTPDGLASGARHLDLARERWRTSRAAPDDTPELVTLVEKELSNPTWVQAMFVARCWVAARSGDGKTLSLVSGELETHLEDVAWFTAHSEQLTYAEALVAAEDRELRDPDRAEELYLDYLERADIAPGEWPDAYDPTIRNLLARIEESR